MKSKDAERCERSVKETRARASDVQAKRASFDRAHHVPYPKLLALKSSKQPRLPAATTVRTCIISEHDY